MYRGGGDTADGHLFKLGHLETFPGGMETIPGGMQTFPGGMETFPGGMETFPGGIIHQLNFEG